MNETTRRSVAAVPVLRLKSLRARAVVLKLRRPVLARIATITEWPLILIDLYTEEGIVGRSYLEPYTTKTMKYLIPALHDLGEMLQGRPVAPCDLYSLARKSLISIVWSKSRSQSLAAFAYRFPAFVNG